MVLSTLCKPFHVLCLRHHLSTMIYYGERMICSYSYPVWDFNMRPGSDIDNMSHVRIEMTVALSSLYVVYRLLLAT